MRNLHTAMKSSPHSPQLEKTCTRQWRPSTTKINNYFLNFKKSYKSLGEAKSDWSGKVRKVSWKWHEKRFLKCVLARWIMRERHYRWRKQQGKKKAQKNETTGCFQKCEIEQYNQREGKRRIRRMVIKTGFLDGSDDIHLQCRRPRFDPWVRKIPCRREWLPIPVFLPGEFRGQRSLVGYSPWGHKESDMTEQLD